MAKVHVEYDTCDKSAKCHVDGKELPNVQSVGLSRKWTDKADETPKYYMSIQQHEHDAEHDIHHHHHTMAAEQVPAGQVAADVPELPGFKVVTKSEKGKATVDKATAALKERNEKAISQIVDYFDLGS